MGASSCDLAGCARSIAGGTEQYYFVVNGPPNANVLLNIVGSVSASTGGDPASPFPAAASASLDSPGGVLSACSSVEAGSCGTVPSSAGLNTQFQVTTGSVQAIEVSASGSAFGGTFQANADPTITIDPTSLAKYPTLSLAFSSNRTPVPAIPATAITVFAEGTNGPTETSVYGSLSNSAANGGPEGGSENSFASAAPGLTVSANGSTSGGGAVPNASAQSIITVYYEVTGPANIPVPLIISGSGSTSAAGLNAAGEAYIYYADGSLYTCSSTIVGPCGSEPASGSLDAVEFTNTTANALYDLQVIASGDSTGGSGSFSAYISCVSLTIDPTWLESNPGYRLKFGANAEAALCPPTVTPEVTGTVGANGWYTSKTTTLKWMVTGKPAPTKSGCETVTVPDTTGTTYLCSASNSAGNASNSVLIKKDSVKPAVTITTPANGASYALHSAVYAAYACTDATSGVDTCSGTVADGAAIKTGSAGTKKFTVTSTDNAGNKTTQSVSYTVN